MMDTITTTNVRMPRKDLIQLKAAAAEHGMSFNQYVTFMIHKGISARELGIRFIQTPSESPIWNLPHLVDIQTRTPQTLSPDDEEIYT